MTEPDADVTTFVVSDSPLTAHDYFVPALPQDGNAEVVRLWLHGKSPKTQRDYRKDLAQFFAAIGQKPLNLVNYADLVAFDEAMAHLKPSTRHRRLAAVKSVLSFASIAMPKYFPFNAGAAFKLHEVDEHLAERYLSEVEVLTIIATEKNARNRLIMRILYLTLARRFELCNLSWRHVQPRRVGDYETGQIAIVNGKGHASGTVLLDPDTWRMLMEARGTDASPDDPVFPSRQRDPVTGDRRLKPSQVYNIVRQAAKNAGITNRIVGPHTWRHSGISHMLDNLAPIGFVAEVARHKSLKHTQKYIHTKPGTSPAQYLRLGRS